MRFYLQQILYIMVVISCCLVLWQGVVSIGKMPRFILPGPMDVFESWRVNHKIIFENMLITALEIVAGLVLGTLLGMGTALGLARFHWIRKLGLPLLLFTQAIPIFALAPILTLWFGYGIMSKIMMTIMVIYFPITSSFLDGLLNIPSGLADLNQIMLGKKKTQNYRIYQHIYIPNALPNLASGLRLSAVYAPIGAILGEWVAASKGLGYLMLIANGRSKTALLFAALMALMVLTISLYLLMNYVSKKLENYSKGL